MKILVATDSFKGSISSLEAGLSIQKGIKKAKPDYMVIIKELADGGEGTSEVIAKAIGAENITVSVNSPIYGKKVNATYAVSGTTAIIEMAQASGITLVSGDEKNPMITTTYGVGEMIIDALNRGCSDFIVGLGGSATNDCGIGMLKALGFSFTDKEGKEVGFGANAIKDILSISCDNADKRLKDCNFTVACDVTNPLCGEQGCSYIFAKQKGANQEEIILMDKWINDFSLIANKKFNTKYDVAGGSGAAGGLGYAFFTFLNAKMRSGAEIVMEKTGILDLIDDVDIVITGEGRMDGQSINGKAPITLAKKAKEKGKKVLAFCGCLGENTRLCNQYIDGYFSILNEVVPLEKALEIPYASKNLEDVVNQVFNII